MEQLLTASWTKPEARIAVEIIGNLDGQGYFRADAEDVATVLLVAPSTPEERIEAICQRTRGFVYAVGRMGVTGEQAVLADSAREVAGRIQAITDVPVCVGIGVSNPEQAATVCEVADGVVVGSALVRRLLEGGGPDGAAEFVGSLRAAIDKG